MGPMPQFRSPGISSIQEPAQYALWQQSTAPQSVVSPLQDAVSSDNSAIPLPSAKRKYTRIIAVVLTIALAITLYFIWFAPFTAKIPSSAPSQNFSGSSANTGSSTTNSSSDSSGDIQAYVVGAVKHPGVYTLPSGARVYQLLQAAGGALPNANLVALNLAATLTDGQEVYVIAVGESPPTYVGGVPGTGTGAGTSGGSSTGTGSGQLVNINTASIDEMRQSLHISSTTAQNIINYRTQHGPFTSIDQLLQIMSKTTYDKIKNEVTI